jgi:hypothetical protein
LHSHKFHICYSFIQFSLYICGQVCKGPSVEGGGGGGAAAARQRGAHPHARRALAGGAHQGAAGDARAESAVRNSNKNQPVGLQYTLNLVACTGISARYTVYENTHRARAARVEAQQATRALRARRDRLLPCLKCTLDLSMDILEVYIEVYIRVRQRSFALCVRERRSSRLDRRRESCTLLLVCIGVLLCSDAWFCFMSSADTVVFV